MDNLFAVVVKGIIIHNGKALIIQRSADDEFVGKTDR
jgi:hypothetical protein